MQREAHAADDGSLAEALADAVDGKALLANAPDAEAVILAPSNPFVSIGPILAVQGVREALETSTAVRAAISPMM